MKVDKTKWENALIKDSIKTLKVKDAVQKKDYLLTGKYPIISQEKDFISGYCNIEDNLNEILEEVIIFGDHTRIVKYVDFDFCVGADGVKVLRPNNKLSAKYLYYFIKWSNIPSNGYSRHFKFLKDIEIKYPKDKSIQQTIASELDAIQTMIDGYKAQLEDLDALAQSIFLDMFGDPVSNPKGWETPKLTEFATLINGRAYSQPELLDNGKYRVLRVGNLFSTKDYYYSDLELEPNKYIENGDLIYAWSCTFGAYIWKEDKVIYHYHIWKVELKEHANKTFVMFVLNLKTKELMNQLHGVGMMHFTKAGMEKNEFILPPLTLQQQFATRVEQIEQQKEQIRFQLKDAETLMAERMQYYFS